MSIIDLETSSLLHKKIGAIFRESKLFSKYRIFQEYPVIKINPDYPFSRHRYDWVVLDLKLIIEVMGQQHFRPISFGPHEDKETTFFKFQEMKLRDYQKQQSAIDAGFFYLALPYNVIETTTDLDIYNLYKQLFQEDQER